MKLKILMILLFCVFCAGLSAQSTAQEMENLLASREITYAQASRFVLEASGELVTANAEEAFWYAAARQWLPTNVTLDERARLDNIALLLMGSFNLEGGIMYSITRSSHYAYRELIYRNVIQGRVDPYMSVSGEMLLFLTGRVLAEREREDAARELFAEKRMEMEPKEKMEPDSFDFGIILNQNISASGVLGESIDFFGYRLGVVPRMQWLFGEIGHFFISLGLTGGYNGELYFIPELLRTELSYRFGRFGVTVGRLNYTDPLNSIASSLFDGLQLSHNSPAGRLSLSAWYTGLLYKNNAIILMTPADRAHFDIPIDRDDMGGTYFAPPRLIVALDYEHPSIAGFMQLNTSLMGQMDLTGNNDKLHSQYFTMRVGIPINNLYVMLGGSFGITQTVDVNADVTLMNVGAAGEVGLVFTLPSNFSSRLSFFGRYASGVSSNNQTFSAFVPITTTYFGNIFRARTTGLISASLDYSARFTNTFGTSIIASYFIRNDLEPINSNLIIDNDGLKRFLGAELFTQFVWNPFSDMQYVLGAGFFIPALGNNWPNARTVWRIDLTTVFALF